MASAKRDTMVAIAMVRMDNHPTWTVQDARASIKGYLKLSLQELENILEEEQANRPRAKEALKYR